ncbi:MAG: hypothetical protein IT437_06755 [Phycisphaerales bacterium]|nr:hypothetical protein [Phycisphaerales bacterium]
MAGDDAEDRVKRAERLAREILARRPRAQAAPEEPADGPDLGDTPALAPDPTGLVDLPEVHDAGAPGVDYRGSFDRVHQRETGALDRFDPEAGKMGLGTRIQLAVRASVRSPFGRFIVAILLGLVGVSLAIVALTFQTVPLYVAAGVLTPASLVYLYIRYQQWLGHKRYLFRLLETLGEDVSDFDINRRYRGGKRS